MRATIPPFYFIDTPWYKGAKPKFFRKDGADVERILEDNFDMIRAEILEFYDKNGASIQENYTPYNADLRGWRSVNLYTLFLKYPKNCRAFPKLNALLKTIPGMNTAMVSVLDPGARIPAHLGDTDGIIRHHLGILVPDSDAEKIGLNVGGEVTGWQEGRAFSFCNVHRHKAWNKTDQLRIVLIVDTVRAEFLAQKEWVASRTLASIATKHFATVLPFTKRLPRWALYALHFSAAILFRCILWIEKHLGIHLKQFAT